MDHKKLGKIISLLTGDINKKKLMTKIFDVISEEEQQHLFSVIIDTNDLLTIQSSMKTYIEFTEQIHLHMIRSSIIKAFKVACEKGDLECVLWLKNTYNITRDDLSEWYEPNVNWCFLMNEEMREYFYKNF